MALTRDAVQAWLDAYIRAWLTYDPEAIGALFSEDATYAWHPWDKDDDVVRGRAAIVKAWLDDKDAAGSYQGSHEAIAVDGDVAVATGVSRYFTRQGELKRMFHNCWVVRFDAQGRCASFVEWFMQAPQ